jgi:hypothetical protein
VRFAFGKILIAFLGTGLERRHWANHHGGQHYRD